MIYLRIINNGLYHWQQYLLEYLRLGFKNGLKISLIKLLNCHEDYIREIKSLIANTK